MRFNKLGILIFVVLFLFVITACTGDNEEDQAQEDAPDEEQDQTDIPDMGEYFQELDRTNLEEDKVVATYEGGQVSGAEFADYLATLGFVSPLVPINDAQVREDVLKTLIIDKIAAANIGETEWAQEQAQLFWEEQLEPGWDEETRQQGYDILETTEEDVKQFIQSFFITQAYFREQITDDEVEEYYKALNTIADVRHILIKTHEVQPDGTLQEVRDDQEARETAEGLYQQLQDGADFAELAAEHTEDEGSKEDNGLYEDASVIGWVSAFRDAALEQEIGEIGQPVKSEYGYHIIRVEDRRMEENEETTLEELTEPIKNEITYQKFDEYLANDLPYLIKEINL